MSATRPPAEVFPPGEFIVKELVARFANDIGVSLGHMEAICRGDALMTEQDIRRTAAYFGTSKDLWRGLNDQWRQRKDPER